MGGDLILAAREISVEDQSFEFTVSLGVTDGNS